MYEKASLVPFNTCADFGEIRVKALNVNIPDICTLAELLNALNVS
jgi:hypothetical protein